MVAADSSSSTPAASLRHNDAQEQDNGRTPVSAAAAASEKGSNGTVRKAKNREITSRYKVQAATHASTAAANATAAQAAAAARRHPSPNLGRSMSGDPPPVVKRALSAERRRAPWPSVALTSPEPKVVVSSSSSEEVWPGVKPRATSRPEGLWPSSRIPEGPTTAANGGGEEAKSSTPDHTLKPTANGIHRAPDSSGGPPIRKGSPMRRASTEQTENARPIEHSRSKPDLQRWPGSSNGKVFSGAMTRSVDLSADRDRSISSRSVVGLSQNGRPGTSIGPRTVRPSANPLNNLSSRTSFSRSINEGPVGPVSRPNSRNNTPERSARGRVAPPPPPPPPPPVVASRVSKISAVQVSPKSVSENGSSGDSPSLVRQSSDNTVLAGLDTHSAFGENASDTESVSSAGSGTTGSTRTTTSSTRVGNIVPSRVWATVEATRRRFSEGPGGERLRNSMSEQDLAAALLKNGRRKVPTLQEKLHNTSTPWSLSPGRQPLASSPQPPLSPSARGNRGNASPLRGVPSPTRTRPPTVGLIRTVPTGTGSITTGPDMRIRGKKAMSQQEEALLLRILHNRFLQWRFINARADAALNSQKAAAEKSLYSVWLRTSELRASVAMQRIKLQQAKHSYKLSTILSNQASHLQNWSSLKQEHSMALSGVIDALEASILRVPVTGGARADVQQVKEALGSAVDVMNAVELSVKTLLPKAQSMDGLVAQLAETAAQERALLAGCGDLLSMAASLEIEERSLSTHLVQLQHEKNRPLISAMDSGMAASDFVRLSSP